MSLIAPDLLIELQSLSVATLGSVLAVGLGLLITGWWGHRFWITVLTSLGVGLYGLRVGPEYGVQQPVIAGVLLALAGGCLALALARLALFAIYGIAVWQVMLQFAPQYAVPLICITAGGLFSVFFFRLCIILLTSIAGAILIGYAGLALAGQQGFIDAKAIASEYLIATNVGIGLVGLVGIVIQQRISRAMRRAELRRREEDRYRRRPLPERIIPFDAAGLLATTKKAG